MSRPSALSAFTELSTQLRGRQLAVFLDYDGTLTPIVPHPSDAHLSAAMRDAVRDLAQRLPVAIVSGRDREDVTDRVGLEGLYYAGSHGFDISGPGGVRLEHPGARAALPALDAAETELGERLAAVTGAHLERKRFSLAVHYRHCSERDSRRVLEMVERVTAVRRSIRVIHGKKVYDLQPDIEWDKGRAVHWILEQLRRSGSEGVAIYLGDDVTDEDAFRALEGLGITIFVGPSSRETAAAYQLADPREVEAFLRRLARHLR